MIFFEPKALYHGAPEEVPDEREGFPLGRARVRREGGALTLVAYDAMVHVAMETADHLRAEDGVEAAVVDVLTISPLDREILAGSARKRRRVVVIHEAPKSFGSGPEIATSIMEGAFLSLQAPIARVTGHDVPFVGFSREQANLPDVARTLAAARETLAF